MTKRPSYSTARKWNVSLSVMLSVLAVVAIVLMVNYLAARHFQRFSLAASLETSLSPLTVQVLKSLTNDVKVIIYYDKENVLYDAVWALLKQYKFTSSRVQLQVVDHERDPAGAQLVKAQYRLSQATDKNLVIFDCKGTHKTVDESELSDLDFSELMAGKSREVRRTHFKGEMEFTSAILNVTSLRSLKACFLEGHGEHRPDSDDKLMGYSEFGAVLLENNIQVEKLSLTGTNDVPLDCHLLIVAAPADPLLWEEVDKIDRYLKQGGRLLVLFNYLSVNKPTGLEKMLANWGVAVGNNVVIDRENSITGQDLVVMELGNHPITRPLYKSRLYMVLPRSINRAQSPASGAETPTVENLASTGPHGQVITDVRRGALYPSGGDFVGSVPLAVAVERGRLPGVSADRGSTRLVVVGESIFLGNETIQKLANRDFASLMVNWLLDRSQLLGSLGPRPIREYKVVMTKAQMSSVRWLLLLGMPGAVLLLGLLVSVRRRR